MDTVLGKNTGELFSHQIDAFGGSRDFEPGPPGPHRRECPVVDEKVLVIFGVRRGLSLSDSLATPYLMI